MAIGQQFSFMDKHQALTKENYNMLQEPLEQKFSGYQLIIAFEFGIIIAYDFLNQVVASLYNYDFEKREPLKNKTVTQLIVMPEHDGEYSSFLAVFEDSTIYQYYFNIEIIDYEFLQEIDNYTKKFQIFDAQKFTSFKKMANGNKIVYYTNPNLSGLTINSGQCNFISLSKISEKTAVNPKAFCKFNTPRITEVAIVSNSFFNKFLPNSEDYSQKPLILVITGSDGVLRLFDYNEKIIVFAFQSSYDGITSFTFSSDYRYIALACQDDTAVLLDLKTFTYYQFYNNKSFVTRMLFYYPRQYISTLPNLASCEILRLIVSSLDSTISLIEIKPEEKYDELENSCQTFRSSLITKKFQRINDTALYPITCSLDNIDGLQIAINPEKIFFKTQRDLPIGNIKLVDSNYLLVTCYDGSLILLTIEVQEVKVFNPNSYGFQYSFTEANQTDKKFKDIKRSYKKYQSMKSQATRKTNWSNQEEGKVQE